VRPVAVLGNLSRDRVPGLGDARVGGAPFYAARALRRSFARDIRIGTRCAEKDRDLCLAPLMALSQPVSWRAAQTTAAFSYSYSGDERFMEVDAIADPWELDGLRGWLDELLDPVDWVHVAPLARSDFPAETLAVIARGRRVLLDGQGLVREPRTGPLRLDPDFDRDLLTHVTALKLAEEEAIAILGGEPTKESLAQLGVAEVLVTRGSRGALVFAEGQLVDLPARAVEAADPTGAGDAFCVLYATARSRGRGPIQAARQATALASLAVAGRL
jgi:sugar/nucleoside kinase (ribokinase family)